MTTTHEPAKIFKTEAQEREFWEQSDSADHVDWSNAARVRLPNLRPAATILLRVHSDIKS